MNGYKTSSSSSSHYPHYPYPHSSLNLSSAFHSPTGSIQYKENEVSIEINNNNSESFNHQNNSNDSLSSTPSNNLHYPTNQINNIIINNESKTKGLIQPSIPISNSKTSSRNYDSFDITPSSIEEINIKSDTPNSAHEQNHLIQQFNKIPNQSLSTVNNKKRASQSML